jgi:hypothetical protein
LYSKNPQNISSLKTGQASFQSGHTPGRTMNQWNSIHFGGALDFMDQRMPHLSGEYDNAIDPG